MASASPGKSDATKRPHAAAFTLVEVALATGIASFALVALIGMLPIGLATQRQAVNNTVESQIVQAVTNDVLLTDFSTLTQQFSKSATKTYTFDYSGQPVATNQAGDPVIYTATMALESVNSTQVGPSTQVSPVSLQTQASSVTTNQGYSVIITVINSTNPRITDTYSVFVANTSGDTIPTTL